MSKSVEGRRRFLLTLGLGGAGAAGAAIAKTVPQPAESEASPVQEKKGYRLTEHIAKFYKSARL